MLYESHGATARYYLATDLPAGRRANQDFPS